jgi:N-acyl-D-aspartate/D-glutamate deacylase
MPKFDVLVKGGTLVDGTGSKARAADVGIVGDRVVAVGTDLGDATRVIDATGKLVTPGFVDIHTHYDGQATWDERMQPSSWHGVTTAVMGNWGMSVSYLVSGCVQNQSSVSCQRLAAWGRK